MTGTAPMPLPGPLPDERTQRPALIGRFAATLADLLAAGTLILGLGLVAVMLVLPAPGTTAFDATTGPGWSRAVAHLAVGIAGEAAGQFARRRSWPTRVTLAVVTVVAVSVVLTLSWWR